MEKFSNWRDKGTGIAPFMPHESPKSTLVLYVLDPFVLLLKWPLLVVLYGLISVAPKAITKQLLSLLSVSDIDLLVEGVRKLRVDQVNASKPTIGEVVVSNHVSPLDVFVVFVTSNVSSLSDIQVIVPQNQKFYSFTVWEVLAMPFNSPRHVLDLSHLLASPDPKKLALVFAEGSTTNNKAVLAFDSSVTSMLADKKVKVAVLRYYPATVSLPVPHMSRTKYVSKLLTAKKGYVKVKLVPQEKTSISALQNAFLENGLSAVELTPADKASFYDYYLDFSLQR